jgi:glucose-1-phosphate thymidylyltransferase
MSMKCVIPCAGFGTRLKKLGFQKPKSLLHINDSTILDRLMHHLETVEEIDEVFVVTNDVFLKDFEEWKTSYSGRLKVRVLSDGTSSNEDRLGPLGTSLKAVELIEDDFAIIYGDEVFDFDLADCVKTFYENGKNLIVVSDVGSLEVAKNFGTVNLDEEGFVTGVVEKPEHPESTLIFAGFAFFRKESKQAVFRTFENRAVTDTGSLHVFDYLPEKSMTVYRIPLQCKWLDVGLPDNYFQAQKDF